MTIGAKIAKARKAKGLSQEYLAWKTDVSVQAVSAWENDKNMPDRDHLIALSKALDISLEELTSGRPGPLFEPGRAHFDPERMYTYVKAKAQAAGLTQALAALPVMRGAHEGRKREGPNAPYCVRPLTAACHALAMGIAGDDVLAAVLLDGADLPPEKLPVNGRVREALRLLSRAEENGYEELAKEPLAALAACMGFCFDLSSVADGFSRERAVGLVKQMETRLPPLLETIKDVPAWNDAAWLLRYQTNALLETLKRLL